METTAEQIKRLEQELATLKEKERKEKEEAQKKAEAKKRQERAERKSDLQKIEDALNDFNKKYDDTLCLGIKRNSDIGKDLFDALFPWFGD